MCLHFKTIEVPYEGPHDVITLTADRQHRCILAAGRARGQWKTQLGQLNQSPYRVRGQGCGVSSHQTCSITFSKQTDSFYWGEKKTGLLISQELSNVPLSICDYLTARSSANKTAQIMKKTNNQETITNKKCPENRKQELDV